MGISGGRGDGWDRARPEYRPGLQDHPRQIRPGPWQGGQRHSALMSPASPLLRLVTGPPPDSIAVAHTVTILTIPAPATPTAAATVTIATATTTAAIITIAAVTTTPATSGAATVTRWPSVAHTAGLPLYRGLSHPPGTRDPNKGQRSDLLRGAGCPETQALGAGEGLVSGGVGPSRGRGAGRTLNQLLETPDVAMTSKALILGLV